MKRRPPAKDSQAERKDRARPFGLSARLAMASVRRNYQVSVFVPSLNRAPPVSSGLPT